MFPEPLEIYHNKTAGPTSYMVLQDISPVHSEGRTDDFPWTEWYQGSCIHCRWHTHLKNWVTGRETVNNHHIYSIISAVSRYVRKKECHAICSQRDTTTINAIKLDNLLMYLLRIASKFLGANLPLITNLCCPSSDPLVPISASKNIITCSGCLCILKIQLKVSSL